MDSAVHAARGGRHTRQGRYPTLAASATEAKTTRFASPTRCSWAQPRRQMIRVLAQLLPAALGVSARAGGRAVVTPSRMKPHDAALGRVDPEPVGQLLEARRPGLEASEEPLRKPGGRVGLEELIEHRVDPIHVAIPPALASRSPCLARADS